MFREDTVFVLGAGASWHYGYPTGEQLVADVVDTAQAVLHYCRHVINEGVVLGQCPAFVSQFCEITSFNSNHDAYEKTMSLCKGLIDRLRAAQPLVIDYFLGLNKDLQPIGKLMIAAVLLKCEAEWHQRQANVNRMKFSPEGEPISSNADLKKYKDNWCRFIVHGLVTGCTESTDLLKNKINFITFNYDTSLEHELQRALEANSIFHPDHIQEFLSNDRIIHVYGTIHQTASQRENQIEYDSHNVLRTKFGDDNIANELRRRAKLLDACWAAAQSIRTINPLDKNHEPTASKCQSWVNNARAIYILGYAFDELNNERIGLDKRIGIDTSFRINFTNYGDANIVNKKAGMTLLKNRSAFLNTASAPRGHIVAQYVEKSVRNVYDALALDFDPF